MGGRSTRRELVKQESGEQSQPVALIVDDHTSLLRIVSWALALKGFRSQQALDGQAALAWIKQAKQEGVSPTLILLDLAMPKMDGLTFLREVRTLWQQHAPTVVVMTAHPEVANAAVLGVAQVISKPFHIQDLLVLAARVAANVSKPKEASW
jgi:DNA-binding response OmpR family regulator